jgi:hypothetical protein
MKGLLAVVAALAAMTIAPTASAATTCPAWPIVVNAYQRITNDTERGTQGTVWARSDYTRLLRIVRSGSRFCAYANSNGTFRTIAGTSPAGTGTVGEGVTGTIMSHWSTNVFYGSWRPTMPTSGLIGTFDGSVDWRSLFFSYTTSVAPVYWAWGYNAGTNGLYVRRNDGVTGTYGDITGEPAVTTTG